PPPTPSTAQQPVNAESGKRAAKAGRAGESNPVPLASQASASAAPEDAAPPSPARDSLELIVRVARSFVEDTVRSFTGDQGLAGMKDALAERLGGESGDLKDAVRGALGKGKDVVADSLLKEEGRRAIKQTGASLWKKHWRLAAVIVGGWIVIIALGKACSLACSSSPAPQPQKRLELHGQVVDDGSAPTAKPAPSAKPDRKKKEKEDKAKTKTVAPVAEEKPDANQMSPEEEARLLGEKPAAPTGPADAKQQLADKQSQLKVKARAASDANKAIALYTEAIDTDPYATGARDALLERAKLYQATGNLEAATADLFRLKRRPDVTDISGQVDQMLVDIARAQSAKAPPTPPPAP
ncbi:MAG TPA: hypothetical protein VGO62_15615, partial [Myxococcota bacterium]